jgi:hypothetical protein
VTFSYKVFCLSGALFPHFSFDTAEPRNGLYSQPAPEQGKSDSKYVLGAQQARSNWQCLQKSLTITKNIMSCNVVCGGVLFITSLHVGLFSVEVIFCTNSCCSSLAAIPKHTVLLLLLGFGAAFTVQPISQH